MDDHTTFPSYNHPLEYPGLFSSSYYVPMRDGVHLAVDVFLPKGLNQKIPAILIQSRYWRAIQPRAPLSWFVGDAEELMPTQRGLRPFFVRRGYAMVYADVRGTGASFGVWRYPWEPISIQDASDLLEWIVSQPWSDGSVGGMGISYLGTTAELLKATGHPAVKAIIPMFNHPDPFQDIAYPGGLFNARFLRDWSEMNRSLDNNRMPPMGNPLAKYVVRGVRPVNGNLDNLEEAIQEHKKNGSAFQIGHDVTYLDEIDPDIGASVECLSVHQYLANSPERAVNAAIPTYGWASWLDGGTAAAALRRYLTYPGSNHVVIGAWNHGGFMQASPYRSPRSRLNPPMPTQWNEMLRFFDAHLKNIENGILAERRVFFYTLGAETWQSSPTWPPGDVQVQRWYFHPDRQLSLQAPTDEQGEVHYEVDFRASTGKFNRWWELSAVVNKSITFEDRAAQTPYLLTYLSHPLEKEMEICGSPEINLKIKADVPDCVFFIYLEDVAPNGQVYYLTEGILRAIHRKLSQDEPPLAQLGSYHSFKKADANPLTPGEVSAVRFALQPVSALLRAGHRLRVSLAGHDRGTFPRIPSRENPQWWVQCNCHNSSWIEIPRR